ncbi:hypothetical protein GFS31_32190 [Leptolyngbya sp. BL0902]|nr:hypothetical protein GFS31_06410 [Leptolyngbya sp. BL0902]QQE64502.1 hypothetical protein GFS31_11830 [Leptolyngbya sp. BL0902]QQE65060.1 hypothetical protein GFS31_17450 [Leptolyngbya sp. BL0902]QQE65872.1 hypothetical protein GFS31_25640 [Leptolyngbya sp. BL0902]QQE66093.1 hypothetical protein GFS31_27890 [Leptolyngbya sp. BL0902]
MEQNPEATLKERAQKFGVSISALSKVFKKMKITRKKKN